jgi:hypothetical protein
VSTPTVTVIPPGATVSAGIGTASAGAGAPGATPSSGPARPEASEPVGRSEAAGSLESADEPRTRVVRIPAQVRGGRAEDSAPVSGGAGGTAAPRRRPRLALTWRGAPSADAPPRGQPGADGQGRIAPVVLAVVVVCALVGGLAAVAATVGGTTSSPHPAASIAPEATQPPGARAGTGVSRAGATHVASGRADSGRAAARPAPTPTGTPHGVTKKPTAKPAPTGKAGHRAGRRAAPARPNPRPRTPAGLPGP